MPRPFQWLRLTPEPRLTIEAHGFVRTPHSAQVHIAEDLDVRWFGTLKNPSFDHQRHPLVTKGGWTEDDPSVDRRAWQLRVSPGPSSPSVGFVMSGISGGLSTVVLPSSLLNTDVPFGIRVTRRRSDGEIRFFTSEDDGETWDQLGDPVTGGTGFIQDRGDIWIGKDRYSAFTGYLGEVLRVEIRDGIDGTVVASPDFTENGPWLIGDGGGVAKQDPQGNLWTLDDGDWAGQSLVTNIYPGQYLNIPGEAGDFAETPDTNDLDIIENPNFQAYIEPPSWTNPGAHYRVVSKDGGAGERSYRFSIDDGGFMILELSQDGTNWVQAISTVPIPLTDGKPGWISARWFESTKVVRFYAEEGEILNRNLYGSTALGASETQVGDDRTINIDSIHISNAPVRIGGQHIEFDPAVRLKVYRVAIIGAIPGDSSGLTRSNPWFHDARPWQPGDDSTTPAREELRGLLWSLEGNATIQTSEAQIEPARTGVVYGVSSISTVSLQGEAKVGVVYGVASKANPRIVGIAQTSAIYGVASKISVHYKIPPVTTGIIYGVEFGVVPPEVVLGIGSVWNLGLGGKGYLLSTLDQESPFEFRSYEIQSIPPLRPQIDQSDEPGEQTLQPWWARAQHSWHEGAGQDVFDSPFSSRFKYCHARGIDPWREGEASLLHDTEELRSEDVGDHHLLPTPDALYYTFNGNVKRDPDPDSTGETDEATLSVHDGTEINSIVSDGESLYAAFSGATLGIKKTPLEGTMAWEDVNVHADVELLAWVKGRLMGAKGPSIFEYDLAVTTEPSAGYTDPASTWKWTGITEAGPAIYFSGFAGDRSEIFAARLTAGDIQFAGDVTLGALVSKWQAPPGETILAIMGYIGQAMLIGTSLGVRFATVVSEEGDLRVSEIVTERRSDHPQATFVKAFEPRDRFAWFGWSRYDEQFSGLGRLHLGELNWSSDLMFPSQGEVTDIAHYDGRMYFVIREDNMSRIVKEHVANLVEEAEFHQCHVRFGTTEIKTIRYFDLRGSGIGTWDLEMSRDNRPFIPLVNGAVIKDFDERLVDLEGGSFRIKITLYRDTTNPELGPSIREWRLRAEPKSSGRFRYLVPLMIYDHMITLVGAEVGRVGFSMERLNTLVDLYRTGRSTQYQGPETCVPNGPGPVVVVMEDLRFKSFAPPKGCRGFGGIALAVLREVR